MAELKEKKEKAVKAKKTTVKAVRLSRVVKKTKDAGIGIVKEVKIPEGTELKLEASVYNQDGKESGKILLPNDVFATPWNGDLVHQTIVSMTSNTREPIAHTKTRGEVSGGGKKPWQQKGTGRARHGSTRSPLWVGGGVTHGPRNDKNYDRKVNRKMKAKALYAILSRKFSDGEILFVKNFQFNEAKTKFAKEALLSLGTIKGFEPIATKTNSAALIALSGKDEKVRRSFNNFGNIEVDEIRNINPVQALNFKYIVIANPEESLKQISGKI